MKLNSKTILYGTVALLTAGAAYWYFFTGSSAEQKPLTSTRKLENPAQVQFRALVTKLQTLSFDTGILQDERFNALVDLTTPITQEPAGRADPFASLP